MRYWIYDVPNYNQPIGKSPWLWLAKLRCKASFDHGRVVDMKNGMTVLDLSTDLRDSVWAQSHLDGSDEVDAMDTQLRHDLNALIAQKSA